MAQKLALLVSEEKLKAFTSINQNVSPADLIPYILQSQDIVLQNYIGATYYIQLKNEVVTGTVSPNNQFLLDNYIGNAMCNWGLFYALPFLKYKIFNKSVVSPTSENSESITLEELKFLMEQVRSAGETYIKRMIEWMVLHPGNYPAYVAPQVLDGQLPERGNPYFGSLVTPKQPYAWKKRTMVGTRDSANVGWYGGTEGCEPFGMNFYQAPTN
jgi:hypothetical protein